MAARHASALRSGLARASLVLVVIGLLLGVSQASLAQRVDNPDLFAAIVRIRTVILPDARTAATLGREREGSGVVIDDSGLIVTIGFLVIEASQVEITTLAGKRYPASVVAYHAETGFALLRAAVPLGVPSVRLGDARGVAARQPVMIAPHGGRDAAQPAIVASRREFAGFWEYLLDDAIFTAPPVAAFAGAGLFGDDGRLIGIGYLMVNNAVGGDALLPGNMFVPIDHLRVIMADLLAEGRTPGPRRPWLGLQSQEMQGRLFVHRVQEGGPAAQAGIKPGDIVLAVAGQPVASLADFYKKIWAQGAAEVVVPLTVLQGAELKQLSVKSIDRYRWFKTERGL
jgi:S1-C subfamily serine protease